MSIYQSTKVSPYVYWLTHKITGQFYIGYREANKVPSDKDIILYKSSSNKIKDLGFENFNFQIIAEFFDGGSAYNFENLLIEANIKNPLCLNGYYKRDSKWRSVAGKSRPADMFNDQWRRLQRESHLGRKDNQETFLRKSIAQSGENNNNAKIWTLLKESDNTTFEVKSLKPWCRLMDISYDGLGKTKTTGKFYKGFKIICKVTL